MTTMSPPGPARTNTVYKYTYGGVAAKPKLECRSTRCYPKSELGAHFEINTLDPSQAQLDEIQGASSNLHDILISMPTGLANTLMRNENRKPTYLSLVS